MARSPGKSSGTHDLDTGPLYGKEGEKGHNGRERGGQTRIGVL